ncbi:MAG: DUF3305 domain-containing protein [Chromatiales bacterium]|nr:DUF3305 domain-containing protein [Chromatiales bacterium]
MDRFPEPQAEDIRHFPVSVILERRPATSQWVDHVWNAVGITVGRHAESAEAQLVRDEAGTSCYLVGGLEVALFADECESYYYNLVSDNPRAFVLAHAIDDNDQPRPFKVSMSFDEAHAYLEGDDQVYAVDVPPELYRWTEAYVIANYFPEKKRKRKLRDWSADESENRPS